MSVIDEEIHMGNKCGSIKELKNEGANCCLVRPFSGRLRCMVDGYCNIIGLLSCYGVALPLKQWNNAPFTY